MYTDYEEKDIKIGPPLIVRHLNYIQKKDGSIPKFHYEYEYDCIMPETTGVYADSLEEANDLFEDAAEGEVEQIYSIVRRPIKFEDPNQLKLL